MSDCLWPHGRRSLVGYSPWDFLSKSTGVGCHFLLQGIFPTQGLNLGLPALQADALTSELPEVSQRLYPLQYPCLENPMDRVAWQAAVHGVAEGRTRLSDFTFHFVLRCEPKAYLTVKKAWILELGNRDQISTNFVNLRKLLNISEFRFSLSLNGEGFILHSDSNI